MTCGIYKIKNRLNNQVYIGQSINIEERWKSHKNESLKGQTKFYKGIQKYGIDNFEWSIIEECSKDELDKKELYWINFYDSVKNGYNSVYGAPFQQNSFRKLSEKSLQELIKDLKDNIISIKEISDKYNLSLSYIYEINRGEANFEKQDLKFPLRSVNSYDIDYIEENFELIKIDLENKKLSYNEIANKYGICEMTIRRINNGERHFRPDINYPIRKVIKSLAKNDIEEIIILLKNSSLSIKEIGDKYNRSPDVIRDINSGKSYHRNDIEYPIRKLQFHRLTSQEVEEIIKLLKNTDISIIEISKQYGVSNIAISDINQGRSHKQNIDYPIRNKS